MSDYLIAPSILAANFARLGEEVDAVLAAGADMVHFDVMDNHYVPNLTVGPMVCQALRDHGVTAPIDVHLMARPVDALIEMFAQAGATYITFHPDASHHVVVVLLGEHICYAYQLCQNCNTDGSCCRPSRVGSLLYSFGLFD